MGIHIRFIMAIHTAKPITNSIRPTRRRSTWSVQNLLAHGSGKPPSGTRVAKIPSHRMAACPSVHGHRRHCKQMNQRKPIRVHAITGGFPPGAAAGHDMDYARLRLLQLLHEHTHVRATVANDFTDVTTWLPDSQLLITYVAGPYPNDEQNQVIRQWLEGGGRWLALHGTSGGKAVRVGEGR